MYSALAAKSSDCDNETRLAVKSQNGTPKHDLPVPPPETNRGHDAEFDSALISEFGVGPFAYGPNLLDGGDTIVGCNCSGADERKVRRWLPQFHAIASPNAPMRTFVIAVCPPTRVTYSLTESGDELQRDWAVKRTTRRRRQAKKIRRGLEHLLAFGVRGRSHMAA